MTLKYDNAKKSLSGLLKFYFQNKINDWNSDNNAEVQQIADEIEDMINEKIKETFQKIIDQK